MSDKVVPLFEPELTPEAALAVLRARYPEATKAIVVMFEPAGGVHIEFADVDFSDMSVAAVYLSFIAGKGISGE